MKSLESILANHPFFENLEDKYLDLITGCASMFGLRPVSLFIGRVMRQIVCMSFGRERWH